MGATFAIMCYFRNDPKMPGMFADEFLRDWAPFTLEITYDDKVERVLIDRTYVTNMFNASYPNQGPRVTKRN
jgi:hypothetical protein